MRSLPDVSPSPEQLAILSRTRAGIEVIRGAAGSGKTTTALLRLRALVGMFLNRRRRQKTTEPVRILILTYNRTLRGYIEALARHQFQETEEIKMEVYTFGKWAQVAIGCSSMIPTGRRKQKILGLGRPLGLPEDFLLDEVEYAMGRFLPEKIEEYVTVRRDGRGASPRMEKSTRVRLVSEVIKPYQEWIDENKLWDWNDLAVFLAGEKLPVSYDVVIVDEAQDFSANQIRGVINQLASGASLTLVLDTAQRIYARGYTWQEVGVKVGFENSKRLENNYRNTKQIARFAASLVEGIPIDDDATLPDFSRCNRDGAIPVVVKGRFQKQAEYAVRHIQENVDLQKESVAFLHPLGGGWLDCVRGVLNAEGLEFSEITRRSDWPDGEENIALSTLHSAKGLEFDHVIILGLNSEVLRHGEEEGDDRLMKLRRLLAMGIGRARNTVVLGYKPEDASRLIGYLDSATFKEVAV